VPLRFLVDENLPADVAGLLERSGYESLYIGASPLRGATDEAL
jgi:predicted nuclease of predicted toxin-antitoxin system